MVLREFFFLLLLTCMGCSEASEEPLTGSPMEKGEQLYQIHCIRCHGSEGSKGASGAADLTNSDASNAEIVNLIKKGKGVMPSYENIIKGDSSFIWLSDYVETLQK